MSCYQDDEGIGGLEELKASCSFCFPSVSEASTLGSFAVESNNAHQTRTCSDAVALDILKVDPEAIESGNVEKLLSPDGRLVGFYSLKEMNQTAKSIELGHVFVHPEFHRKGFGSIIFNRAVEKAKNCGAQRMHWISDPGAAGFYRKLGAEQYGEDENILNPAENVPLMEYILS